MEAGALVTELKRRRVIRALVGYGIASFAVLQIIEPIMHGLHWPDEVLSYVVVVLAVGFPIVVTLAWIFDVNAGRIERTPPASGGAPSLRGPRLALVLVGVGVLAATPGVVWYFVVRGAARPLPSSAVGAEAVTPSIAVLAFTDMSPGKDQEYFSDGIAEEILNALAHVQGLRVIGRTSSFSFKGKNTDLRSIGKALDAGSVLEGSVRKAGDVVRITAQLISTQDGSHRWSETYDRKLVDVFAVQDEIAKAVVASLKVKLLPGASPVRAAHDPEAHRLLLLGRSIAALATDESVDRSTQVLKKAVEIEPSYAEAWADLAQLHGSLVRGAARAEFQHKSDEALAEAERAIALEPGLAEGYAARGYVRGWLLWDWTGAQADLERARALNSGSATVLNNYAGLLQKLGHLKEAIAVQRKAVEIDPLNADRWDDLSAFLLQNGQLGAARDALARSQEISPNYDGFYSLGFIDLLEGHPAKALALWENLTGKDRPVVSIAIAEYELGHERESQEALATLVARAEGPAGNSALRVAAVHAWRGERDLAFEWLDRAYAQHEIALRLIKVDPYLRKLHGDPRWPAFLKKMNLPLD